MRGYLVGILNQDTTLIVCCPEPDDDVDEEYDDGGKVDDLEEEFCLLLPVLRRKGQGYRQLNEVYEDADEDQYLPTDHQLLIRVQCKSMSMNSCLSFFLF